MNQEINLRDKVYVLTEEAQEVIGERGLVQTISGDTLYVAKGDKFDDPGVWLKREEVSTEKPVDQDADEEAHPVERGEDEALEKSKADEDNE